MRNPKETTRRRKRAHQRLRQRVIGTAQQQVPGMPLTLLSTVDAHHDVVRFSWGLGPAGAEPLVIGTDSVLLAEDGRFALITGYLDKVPG